MLHVLDLMFVVKLLVLTLPDYWIIVAAKQIIGHFAASGFLVVIITDMFFHQANGKILNRGWPYT